MTGANPTPSPRRRRGALSRLLDRPTGDIMILLIAVTICGAVLTIGLTAIVFVFAHPDADLSAPARFVTQILNTMVGLLAGYLAGRTERSRPSQSGDDGDDRPA